ncbi:hypothetical protein [Streptomyces sp. NPDC004065]|uniref:hypothetical protein n=1 Tax=Streptomyces sp. NPDC004065 TaxID=3364689 RepID=UPI00384C5F45
MKNAEPEHEQSPEPPRQDDHVIPVPPLIPFTEPWEYELHFPRDPRGPAVARTTLKAVLGAHGLGEFTDRAELLTSELTTNASATPSDPPPCDCAGRTRSCGSA